MCTVVIEVSSSRNRPTRVLALRDEHPDRAWDPLGNWWPAMPNIVGVRDKLAGGAWLAVNESQQRLGVILNRGEPVEADDGPLDSRGAIALDAAQGTRIAERPYTASFNLVEATPDGALVTTWNGQEVVHAPIEDGVHMIAHSGLDDRESPRIAAWLDTFRRASASASDETWRDAWVQALESTASLDATDDRAIVRDNRPLGIPTLTLYAVMAELSHDGVMLWHATLDQPGQWGGATFTPVASAR